MKHLTLSVFAAIAVGSLLVSCSPTPPTADAGGKAESGDAIAPAAQSTKATKPAIYIKDNVAISGADPVAYFTDSQYVPGSSEYTFDWQGATWQFASAEHRDKFAANPEQYAPQYGGFCAWGVVQGAAVPTDPNAWKIVNGKLYLNLNKGIQKKWEGDIPGNIAKADQDWPAVLSKYLSK